MSRDIGRRLAYSQAQRAGINPDLFSRLVGQESGFNLNAYNASSGAFGGAQLMPDTARDPGYGVRPWDGTKEDNIRMGADYFAAMQREFKGDIPRALAAYNWGPGNAAKWDGNMESLPAETRDYIQKIYYQGQPQDQMSFLGDEVRESGDDQRNRPVALTDEAAEKPKAQLHLGMGLSGLGAALSASARGESVAGDLDAIRGRYFAEREAEEAKVREERARIAAIEMVGADSPWGEALASGADPQLVMQDYAQQQGFANAREMQQAGFGHDIGMQQAGFGHARYMQDDSQEFQTNENLADRQFRTGERLGAQEFQQGESAVDREYRTGERLGAQDFSRSESELDRAVTTRAQDNQVTQWRTEMAVDLEATLAATSTQTQTGEAVRDLIVEQYEAAGLNDEADRIRARDPKAFADPQIARTFIDAVGSASKEDDIAEGLRAASTYVEMMADGRVEEAAAFGQKLGLIPSAGQTIHVNGGENEFDKDQGKRLSDFTDGVMRDAYAADELMQTVNQLGTALEGGLRTGAFARPEMAARKMLGIFGMSEEETARMSQSEAAVALQNQLALMVRNPDGAFGGMPGAVSDRDIQFLLDSVPNMGNTPDGNRKLVEAMTQVAQRKIEFANEVDRYVQSNGKMDHGVHAHMREWQRNQPDLFVGNLRPAAEEPSGSSTSNDGWTTMPNGVRIREKR